MNQLPNSPSKGSVGDPFAADPLRMPRQGKAAVKSTGAMGVLSADLSLVVMLIVKRYFPDLPEAEAVAIVSVFISLAVGLYGRLKAKLPITSIF